MLKGGMGVLIVSDFAAVAIRHLLEQYHVPPGAGLRIARAATTRSLKVRFASAPAPEDTVVIAADGARVFLDRAAASLLDGKVLVVTIGARGRVEFFTADAGQRVEPGR
jgi:Fe-S cluster assembly iron-binding protein IscA